MGVVEITALLGAFGIGALLLELLRYGLKKNDTRQSNVFGDIFKAKEEINMLIDKLRYDTPCHRVTIIKTTNGGGAPTLAGDLYSTVLYESYDFPLRAIKKNWINQKLDSSYLKMLHSMHTNGGKLVLVAESLEDGILKDLYEAQGIKESHIYRITATRKNEYIYLSANFTETGMDTPSIKEYERATILKLRSIFIKNQKV